MSQIGNDKKRITVIQTPTKALPPAPAEKRVKEPERTKEPVPA
jgi:hypothetical protein